MRCTFNPNRALGFGIKRMTCRNTFLFIPRNDINGKLILRFFFVFSLWHKENEPFLGGFAPPATERTSAVFSMVLGFILAKTLCPQRHSKVCFELLKTFWVTPQKKYVSWEIVPPKSNNLKLVTI